ncbi:uncharacterized protein LOC109410505 [Aedes albopictus]|uniref:Uncharacterized protein n=1 Tax=Aedes albopictus TaxID=7160 RepID=A0ABM1ZTM1_AEDAL|nr:uncharacterized protein LOC109410505 [Aedes albopictus]KXJ76813.1 hypothetical protein RP20_CCG008888 [Aedes albopictus]
MKHLVSLVLIALTATSVHASHRYRAAAEQCVQYLRICPSRLEQYLNFVFPEDRETMCFIRCVACKLDLWDDKTGLNWPVLEPLLCPSVRDQIDACVCRKLDRIDPYDHCPRAYYAFRCLRNYLQQIFLFKGYRHGEIEVPVAPKPAPPSCTSCSNSFQPLTVTEMTQKLLQCAQKCNLKSINLCDRTTDPVVETPEFECTVYCSSICSGVYSEQKGLLMDNLYAQLGRCETQESFNYRLELCFGRNAQPEGTSPPTVVFQQYFKCLRGDYERFYSSNREELLQIPGINNYCF